MKYFNNCQTVKELAKEYNTLYTCYKLDAQKMALINREFKIKQYALSNPAKPKTSAKKTTKESPEQIIKRIAGTQFSIIYKTFSQMRRKGFTLYFENKNNQILVYSYFGINQIGTYKMPINITNSDTLNNQLYKQFIQILTPIKALKAA